MGGRAYNVKKSKLGSIGKFSKQPGLVTSMGKNVFLRGVIKQRTVQCCYTLGFKKKK